MLTELDYATVEAMEKYGGSFVQALAALIRCADNINFKKLKKAFPEYWKQYEDMAAEDMVKEEWKPTD